MGLLKILFIIAVVTIAGGEILRFEPVKGIPFNLNNIAVGLLVAYWLTYHLLKRKKIIKANFLKPLIVFLGVCLVSLLFNIGSLTLQEFGISSLYAIRFILYLLIYFIVLDFDKNFQKKILYILLFSGCLVLFTGYIQYFFYPSLRNLFYLGWDEHLYRMFSSFLDPNFAGAFFSLYLFLIIFMAEKTYSKKKIFQSISLAFLAILTFVAIFLTYSRSGVFMLLAGSLIFLYIKKKFIFIIVLVLIIFAMIAVVPRAFRTEGTDLFRRVSSEARISSAKQAISIFLKNPVLGIGFNAYKFAKYRYGFTTLKFDTSHAEGGADVSLLFVAATTGIIGLISYLYLVGRVIKNSYKKHRKNFMAGILFVSMSALIINSFFINSLFYSFFMLWIWVLVGLTENA